MSRRLIPATNAPERDSVFTPPALARALVAHFKPWGACLEPCAGEGAFVEALMAKAHQDTDERGNFGPCGGRSVDWFENDPARTYFFQSHGDFLAQPIPERYRWVVTNPPFLQLAAFLARSFEVADHVVFLCPINATLGLKVRVRLAERAGFGVREVLLVDTPPAPWPPSGFQLAAIHWQRGWAGDVRWGRLEPQVLGGEA